MEMGRRDKDVVVGSCMKKERDFTFHLITFTCHKKNIFSSKLKRGPKQNFCVFSSYKTCPSKMVPNTLLLLPNMLHVTLRICPHYTRHPRAWKYGTLLNFDPRTYREYRTLTNLTWRVGGKKIPSKNGVD